MINNLPLCITHMIPISPSPFQDFGNTFCCLRGTMGHGLNASSMKYFVGGAGDPQNYPHNTSHLYTQLYII